MEERICERDEFYFLRIKRCYEIPTRSLPTGLYTYGYKNEGLISSPRHTTDRVVNIGRPSSIDADDDE